MPQSPCNGRRLSILATFECSATKVEADDAGKDDLSVGVPQLRNQNIEVNAVVPCVNKAADLDKGKQQEETVGQQWPYT